MREHLLGYLLGALEPSEHELLNAHLGTNPDIERDLAALRTRLALLTEDREHFDPPVGLAARTCNFVAARASGGAPSLSPPTTVASSMAAAGGSFGARQSWRLQDWLVAASVFLIVGMLLFPAIANSRFNARLTGCQDNLRKLGRALLQYSQFHENYFPVVPEDGNLAVAGMYAPVLMSAGTLESPSWLICPDSPLAEDGSFQVPTVEEVLAAVPPQLYQMQAKMGGSYGFGIGYVEKGRYHGHRNRDRQYFAIMADCPNGPDGGPSTNHGTYGQNVLFENGSVKFVTNCLVTECNDHIYRNKRGEVGPGIGFDDAVIAPSGASPNLLPAVLKP